MKLCPQSIMMKSGLLFPKKSELALLFITPFILSDLKAVALRLLDDILGNCLIGAQSLPCQAAIEAHGSANAVVDMLFATIRPEIIELQGKIVSTATLTCIKLRQSKGSHWSSPVGYASFVTDARNSKYV
ncbi:hypothetical protein J3E68DRAFT_376602 [Trichoderma sp. SZMC 28012]